MAKLIILDTILKFVLLSGMGNSTKSMTLDTIAQ